MHVREDTARKPPIDRLLEEIGRYLAAVDAFRREGCEPSWLAEH